MTKSVKKPYTITDSGMTRAELFEEDIIMKNNSSIKTVVAVGIGAALFFVLGRFVAIPSPVPNTNISLQYAVLALLAAMYGPVAGGLIGFIGHALIDLSWGGSPWWSWVITSAFVGVVIGLFAKKLNVQDGEFGKGKVTIPPRIICAATDTSMSPSRRMNTIPSTSGETSRPALIID